MKIQRQHELHEFGDRIRGDISDPISAKVSKLSKAAGYQKSFQSEQYKVCAAPSSNS